MGLWHTDGSPNLSQKTRPNNNQQQQQQQKRNCKTADFAVPADDRIKLKECEKKDKYLDLARELKKLWNMQVTILPIVIGAFITVTKGLLKRLEDLEVSGRVETIQTTALLRTARILLWEPYPSHHNGLYSQLLVRRDFSARRAEEYRCYPNSIKLLTVSM